MNSFGELSSEVDPRVNLVVLGTERVRYGYLSLIAALRKLRPYTILSTLLRTNLLVLAARPFLRGVRICVREANTPSADLTAGGHSVLVRVLIPILYRTADRIVCQSEAMQLDVLRTYSVAREKTVRIYNPAPILSISETLKEASSPFDDNQRPIVICGRLTDSKGIDLMITGMKTIVSMVPNARLHVIGDGADREFLEKLTEDLGLSSVVVFHGFLPDRFRYLRFADVVVSASRWEGLPNVLLESIACGTPVVATDCPGGTREIVVDGVNGCLVPPGSSSALAVAVTDVLTGRRIYCRELVCASLSDFEENTILDQYQKLLLS